MFYRNGLEEWHNREISNETISNTRKVDITNRILDFINLMGKKSNMKKQDIIKELVREILQETFHVKSRADLHNYLKAGIVDELTQAIADFQKGQYDKFFDVVHDLPPSDMTGAFIRLFKDYERKQKGAGFKILNAILLRMEGQEHKAERDALEHILKGVGKIDKSAMDAKWAQRK